MEVSIATKPALTVASIMRHGVIHSAEANKVESFGVRQSADKTLARGSLIVVYIFKDQKINFLHATFLQQKQVVSSTMVERDVPMVRANVQIYVLKGEPDKLHEGFKEAANVEEMASRINFDNKVTYFGEKRRVQVKKPRLT